MVKKVILIIVLVFSLNCGKKGPLKLEPEILPRVVENIKISQVGGNIRLQWDFPRLLSDKKTELEIEKINKINIYYSDKEILGGKFRKKSTLLRKFRLEELTRHKYETLMNFKKFEELTSYEKKEREKFTFFIDIPFKIKNLKAKSHFFAIRYLYGKKKSPLSRVVFISTQTPVKLINDLKIKKENKLIILQWGKPQMDVSGMAVTNISGYKVYKKMIPKTSDETATGTVSEAFLRINQNKILTEYFEDKDTGTDGKYQYYVSVVISNEIESAPSPIVSVDITDLYPPDIPANLVSFKASDHMFLTWKPALDKDLSHYRVFRKSNNENEFKPIAGEVTTNHYKDKNVQKGVLYFYVVTAVDTEGNESEYSNIVKEEF